MKKTVLSILVLAAVLVALGFVFTACENSTGGGNSSGGGGGQKDILDGTTWETLPSNDDVPSGSGGLRFTFVSSTFKAQGIKDNIIYGSGTYTVSGTSYTGTITGGEAGRGTFNGIITNNGNTLQWITTANGSTMAGTAAKK